MLLVSDYNQEYFENEYYCKRWYRNGSEFYLDRAIKLFNLYDLEGKKVLDIGCGQCFLVNDLRGMGVLADGVDVSEYAVGHSEHAVQADAKDYVKGLKVNEYDLIVMVGFLCCLTDEELTQFVKDVSKKAKQFFIIEWRNFNADKESLYNGKTMEEWVSLLPDNVTVIWRDEEAEWQK